MFHLNSVGEREFVPQTLVSAWYNKAIGVVFLEGYI